MAEYERSMKTDPNRSTPLPAPARSSELAQQPRKTAEYSAH
jgi:hypothetical protein